MCLHVCVQRLRRSLITGFRLWISQLVEPPDPDTTPGRPAKETRARQGHRASWGDGHAVRMRMATAATPCKLDSTAEWNCFGPVDRLNLSENTSIPPVPPLLERAMNAAHRVGLRYPDSLRRAHSLQ